MGQLFLPYWALKYRRIEGIDIRSDLDGREFPNLVIFVDVKIIEELYYYQGDFGRIYAVPNKNVVLDSTLEQII
jgi:hypothetical protein